jgi:sulfur carrier protein
VKISVNGEVEEVADDATVASIVNARIAHGDPRGVAVAVNGEVVPRGEWPAVGLTGGDRVEILRAIGGG